MTTAGIASHALKLPARSRARLAARLLRSLDTPARRLLDEAWAAEVENRVDAAEAGAIATEPASQVLSYRGRKG
jgi:putative addiction module component (TIGR02574 family)